MLEVNFSPFPIFTTKRLILRQLLTEDAPEMHRFRSSPIIMKYIGRPKTKSVADAEELIQRINNLTVQGEGINWGITWKGEDKIIGTIGYVKFIKEHYRAEIGYLLGTEYHRKGIMQEAIQIVLHYGFNILKLHSVEAIIDSRNIASAALLEKTNFVREAHFKENFYWEGQFLDSDIYSILASTYLT